MIGLMLLIYWGVILLLIKVIVFAIIDKLSKKKDANNSVKVFSAVAMLVALTWTHGVGLAMYQIQCSLLSGFYLTEPVDARTGGYLIENNYSGTEKFNNNYINRAVEDLITGRINFFEVPLINSERKFAKYFLDDKGSMACVSNRIKTMLIGGQEYIPTSKCLAREKIELSTARYLITDYNRSGRPGYEIKDFYPSVEDVKTGKTVSQLKWYSHTFMPYVFGDRGGSISCPSSHRYPEKKITAFTFKDRFDFTWPWKNDINLPSNFLQRYGTLSPEKNRLDYGLNSEPSKTCSKFMKQVESDYEKYSVHKIKVYEGKHKINVRLDKSRQESGEIKVFVNTTEHPSILYLKAYDPVVWKIHQEEGANVIGIIVDGSLGQAVIGPNKDTQLFMKIMEDSPRINCSSYDFNHAFNAITNSNARFDSVNDVYSGEWFVVGGEYKSASDYKIYDHYQLKDYTFSKK